MIWGMQVNRHYHRMVLVLRLNQAVVLEPGESLPEVIGGEIQGNITCHSRPLFTLSDCPVIIAARSEARKAMASATSFESGNLPSG